MVDPITPVAITWIWMVALGDTITLMPMPQYSTKAACMAAARTQPHVIECVPKNVGE